MLQKTNRKVLREESAREITRLRDRYPVRKSAILMVLHVVYNQFGYLDRAAIREAADLMELPVIDFEQAASF
jgi:NADH:ubiquinone oxidoreductase subunit E